MIQVDADPGLYELQFPEVDDEPILVRLGAGESQTDAPIVTVNKRAVPVM